MTLGIGWIYANFAYLVADTAASSWAREPTDSLSSFGESERGNGGVRVEEAAQKVAVLSPECAVALSTQSIAFAADLISFLKTHIASFASIEEAIDAMEASFGPFDEAKATEFIFAENKAGVPSLIYWNTLGVRRRQAQGAVQIGSLKAELPIAAVDFIMTDYARSGRPKERFVQVVSACLQMLGVHNDFVAHGVGGLFFGLSVRPEGIAWQPDTSYFIYPPALTDSSQLAFVSAMAREGALIVTSSLNPSVTKILMLAEVDTASLLERVRPEIATLKSRHGYTLWCFISRRFWRALILEVAPGGQKVGFRVRADDGTFHLALRGDFLNYLNRIPQPPPGVPADAFPMDISYQTIEDPAAEWPDEVQQLP